MVIDEKAYYAANLTNGLDAASKCRKTKCVLIVIENSESITNMATIMAIRLEA